MNTALWVIWFALLIAVGFTAFEFGGFFPTRWERAKIRQEGWDAGFDAGFPHGARADGIDPDEWLPAGPQWQYGPRWDDAVEDLMQRGRSYYEPLARGAGANLPPVTTAPCPGETDGDMTLKGDSPGPGLPPLPIFDELAATWPACESPAPIGSPPVGAGPEPPAPVMVPGEMPATQAVPFSPHQEPAAAGRTGNHGETAGAGADPWHQITEANHDVWEVFDDSEVFGMIRWEIAALKRKLSEPWKLTPWKGQPA